MIGLIEKLLTDLEHGKLSRRQFAASVAAVAAGALPGIGTLRAGAQPTGFKAVSINHVTLRVPDLHKTSRFYQEFFGMPLRQQSATVHILGVGPSFFGVEQGDANQKPAVDHFDFGIAGFNADALRAKLKERGLSYDGSNSQESFKFHDADGFQVQVNGPDYVGHVS
jgi:catechol 2,3-dioxygenase-like lactoylglutathione lyase family enzyme